MHYRCHFNTRDLLKSINSKIHVCMLCPTIPSYTKAMYRILSVYNKNIKYLIMTDKVSFVYFAFCIIDFSCERYSNKIGQAIQFVFIFLHSNYLIKGKI